MQSTLLPVGGKLICFFDASDMAVVRMTAQMFETDASPCTGKHGKIGLAKLTVHCLSVVMVPTRVTKLQPVSDFTLGRIRLSGSALGARLGSIAKEAFTTFERCSIAASTDSRCYTVCPCAIRAS